MTKPVLFDYYRSSASYRVRIALNLKGVAYDSVPISLADGIQKEAEYRERNPQGFVPMLEMDGLRLVQSLAIIEYLDGRFPEPRLIPDKAGERAHVMALALAIACDIHPLNNLRVLKYLGSALDQDEAAREEWYRHWVREGLTAMETMAAPRAGRFLVGNTISLADILLVPQMYNARRYHARLDDLPLLMRVDAEASAHPAFAAAHPDRVAPEAQGG